MILGRRTGFTSTDVGTRFLIGETEHQSYTSRKDWLKNSFLEATHLYTVESVSGREMAARDQMGELRLFEINYRGELQGENARNLMWQGTVPNAPFKEIALFANALLSERDRDHPHAFHVIDVSPETITVQLVTFASRISTACGIREIKEENGNVPGDIVTNAFFSGNIEMDPGDHEWHVGAFVVANGLTVRCEGDKRLIAQAKQITTIRERMSQAEIGDWLPNIDIEEEDGFLGGQWTSLASYQDFEVECSRGIARSEPNRAFVYWWPDESEDNSTSCHVLGVEGITFFEVDSIEDYFYGANIEKGLWIFENATWWVDNSWEHHDSGIEGDWRRATIADIAHFGFTLDTLDNEICSILDITPKRGLAAEALAITTPEPVPV